jgi:hypothetical protein
VNVNKIYHLTINNHPLTLTLAPPNQRGYCFKCDELDKEIRVISERPDGLTWEERKFCYSCSLANLEELAQVEFDNKSQVISKIRQALEKNKSAIELKNYD